MVAGPTDMVTAMTRTIEIEYVHTFYSCLLQVFA